MIDLDLNLFEENIRLITASSTPKKCDLVQSVLE